MIKVAAFKEGCCVGSMVRSCPTNLLDLTARHLLAARCSSPLRLCVYS